jgi:hypothetical protein
MEVPCPVPLSQPWSPVGYQVVPLPDANVPSQANPPQVILAEETPRKVASSSPRSPVGYRVVLVADDIVPVPPRAQVRKRPSIMRSPSRRRPPGFWLPFAAVGCFILMPAVALPWMIATRPARHAQPQAMRVDVVIPQELAVVPEAIRGEAPAPPKAGALPPVQQAMPPIAHPMGNPVGLAKDDCADCEAPQGAAEVRPPRPNRDTFQTAVEFARNPQEAARLAKDEGKLTFVLHVAGNFEDPGFT